MRISRVRCGPENIAGHYKKTWHKLGQWRYERYTQQDKDAPYDPCPNRERGRPGTKNASSVGQSSSENVNPDDQTCATLLLLLLLLLLLILLLLLRFEATLWWRCQKTTPLPPPPQKKKVVHSTPRWELCAPQPTWYQVLFSFARDMAVGFRRELVHETSCYPRRNVFDAPSTRER